MPAMSKHNAEHEHDRRFAVDAPVVLVAAEGTQTGCRLVDVSRGGFRARLPKDGRAAPFTKLISGRDIFPIEVRWSTGLELGGVFL